MDKKKVKELIEQAIIWSKQANQYSVISNLEVALDELSKSDWVSVEDGLPPYEESVLVTDKDAPDIVLKTIRVKGKSWNIDKNGFLCAIAYKITHWRPIEKLEE